MVHQGRVSRQLLTLVGAVLYRWVRLHCDGCGTDRYPLDETLKLLPRRNVTKGTAERILWCATELAYDKAIQALQRLSGLCLSQGTVRRLVAEEGPLAQAYQQAKAESGLEGSAASQAQGFHPGGWHGDQRPGC